MKTDAHIIELVEAYLDGRLEPAERSEFEERYASEQGFAEAADSWARQIKLVRSYGEASLKASLNKRFSGNSTIAQDNTYTFRRTLISIAAAIVLLAGVFIGRSLLSEPGMHEMYTDNFSAPSFATRGGETVDSDRQWLEASAYYHGGDFRKAAVLLESLVTQTAFAHISEGHLCLGICYLQMEEPQKALSAFANVKPGSVFVQNAQWYSLLAYLQMEDRESAIKAANVILEVDRHYKADAAKSILEVLQ